MRIEASTSESDLQFLQVGSTVHIEFNYLEGDFAFSGIIEKISGIGQESESEDSEESWFSVMIRPDSTEGLLYGLHAVITTTEAEASQSTAQPDTPAGDA
ncbi:MAG: hypothetical protein IJ246_03890 [Clostridia bacterium]|nr:hypothetical protein [Clostridia bacterium]